MTETGDIHSWAEWQNLDLGETDWLIPGLLEVGGGGLVHGGPRAYKSFLLLQLCLDLAAGYGVLGVFLPVPAKRTLMFQAEGTKRAWKNRLVALQEEYPAEIPFWSRHTSLEKFDSAQGDKRMRAALELIRPDLVVLDPIAEFLEGADTDAVSVQRWTGVINGWRERAGCAVVLVHHDRQPLRFASQGGMTTLDAGMEESRGHTRLTAWADLVLGVKRRDDVTTVRVQKVRDSVDGQEFQFRLVNGKLVLASRSDALEQAVLQVVVKEMWFSEAMHAVCEILNAQERTVRRAIDRLVTRGELDRVTAGGRFRLKPKSDKQGGEK
mgnify:FL=1